MNRDDPVFDAESLDGLLHSALAARPEPVLAADFATRVVRTAAADRACHNSRWSTLASVVAALAMAVVVVLGGSRLVSVLPTMQSSEATSHAMDPYTPLLLVAITAVAAVLAYLAVVESDDRPTA